jgi:hypothetical protein
LLVVLAAALVFVRERPRSDAAAPPPPPPAPSSSSSSSSSSTTEPVADTTALRARFADAGKCADVPGPVPTLRCVIDRVDVEARLLEPKHAQAVYEQESAAITAPRQGPPACARGQADERAWSRPVAPAVAVGRYHCRIEAGRAAIWWTDEHGLVAHAVAVDGDLAALFEWWRAHHDG